MKALGESSAKCFGSEPSESSEVRQVVPGKILPEVLPTPGLTERERRCDRNPSPGRLQRAQGFRLPLKPESALEGSRGVIGGSQSKQRSCSCIELGGGWPLSDHRPLEFPIVVALLALIGLQSQRVLKGAHQA